MPPRRDPLICSLLDPAVYDHPVGRIRVEETHASWIVLTGSYAYKLKKPVDLGFLDFHALSQRKHYCEEEIRLNRRLAPDLYLGVVAITGTRQQPQLGGPGAPIEYAVRMRQFDDTRQLDRMLARGTLSQAQVARFAADLAQFHGRISVASAGSEYGSHDSLRKRILDNFSATHPCAGAALCTTALARLRAWSEDSLQRNRDLLAQRLGNGFVRECHGDLHLANLVLHENRITAFDCLEFSPELRWIDVISELAFLQMDFDYQRRADLAGVFMNRYLEHSGDYGGIALLRHFLVYRAMVRAKVACIRFRQDAQRAELQAVRRHVRLAQHYARYHRPAIVITFGLSGSGKTYVTDRLLGRTGVVRVRSDVERKRLHGLAPLDRAGSLPGTGIYGPESNERTYARLRDVAITIADAGYMAIIDAAFLKRRERRDVMERARALRVPFAILALEARPEVLQRRISERLRDDSDASDATLEVLRRQSAVVEPLSETEQRHAVVLSDVEDADIARTAAEIEGILVDQRR